MIKPTVSVIIPTYNYGRFVCEAIRSVLAQTSPPSEIIVVDDGSVDDTQERLQEFEGQIISLRQENRGLSAARNTGIRASRGQYVALLDSDDVWDPQKLEVQLDHLLAHPELGLLAVTGRNFSGSRPDSGSGEMTPGELRTISREQLIRRTRFGPSGVLVARDCFERAGEFDETLRSAEDRDMWIRIARIRPIALVTTSLWWYRVHESSMSRNAAKMEHFESLVLAKAFEHQDSPLLKRRALSLAAHAATLMYIENREDREAFQRILRSLWLWPLPHSPEDLGTWLARPRLMVRTLRNLASSRFSGRA